MLRHEAVKLSPFGYATRPDARGTMYATAGGLFLEVGGVMKPIMLPPDKVDTWQPVLPEPDTKESTGSTWEPVLPESQQEAPMSAEVSSATAMDKAETGPQAVSPEPERWADDKILPNSKRVVHRGKRLPATL